MSKYFFRDSGFEAEALVANINGDGVILTLSDPNKSIYILGVSCHANTILKQNNNSGNIILSVGSGNYDLPATVKVGNGVNLYVSSIGHVSVIYHIN
jgi:hypothetical protein